MSIALAYHACMKDVKIGGGWKEKLAVEFERPYFKELAAFVKAEYQKTAIFPHPKNIFRAFDLCPFEKVKVVILGQDPYHGAGQANGLCFAVSPGIPAPPSLRNIFKEISTDMGDTVSPKTRVGDTDLSRWAQQGVLLLNATLTVRAGQANSHAGRGWEQLTDAAIKRLNDEREHLVFILWGNYAKAKGAHIDRTKHCVIESAHPSPFSASHGFLGSKPFSKANAYLKANGVEPITW